jgi:hypothetical protein
MRGSILTVRLFWGGLVALAACGGRAAVDPPSPVGIDSGAPVTVVMPGDGPTCPPEVYTPKVVVVDATGARLCAATVTVSGATAPIFEKAATDPSRCAWVYEGAGGSIAFVVEPLNGPTAVVRAHVPVATCSCNQDCASLPDVVLTVDTTTATTPQVAPTFSDIYLRFFGPGGVASCTKNPGRCQGGPVEPGTLSANGFECVPDESGCYASLVKSGTISPGEPDALLLHHLRHVDSATGLLVGNEPLAPASFVFSPADYATIAAWVASGAPNN